VSGRRTVIEHLSFAITCDSRDRVIEDATLVVEDDRVLHIGPSVEIAPLIAGWHGAEVVDGSGLGVTPGFIDTHVHLSETLSRAAFPDSIDTRAWVFQWVMPYYGELTPEDEQVAVRLAAAEMLRSGTTCLLDMGAINDPRLTVPVLADVGIRAVTGRHAADVIPDPIPERWTDAMIEHHFFPSTRAALEELEACVRDLDGYANGLIRCWVNIQGKEPCSAELHAGAVEISARLGVGTTYHVASTAKESRLSELKHGHTPIVRMAELGALGSHVVLAHVVAVTDEEIDVLARHGAKVAFCPGAAFKLAKGATQIGRYPEMQESGVTVSLGTDGVSASGNLNLMRQMYAVAGMFKDARQDPELIGANTALRMATTDGAEALGMSAQIGSLEVGKKADFVVFDLGHSEWVPYQDPIQALVWSATPASIKQTWVDGRLLFDDGKVVTIPDASDLVEDARARARALAHRAGLDTADARPRADAYV
jgi:cytosine/adenosine deaminase-related metal-dependent hydrolase